FDIIKSEEVHTILEAKKGMSLNRKYEPCSTDPRYFAGDVGLETKSIAVDLHGEVGYAYLYNDNTIEVWVLKQNQWANHCQFKIKQSFGLIRHLKVSRLWSKDENILIETGVKQLFVYSLKRRLLEEVNIVGKELHCNAINARRLPLALLVYALMTTSVRNNSVFRSFFEKQKFTRPNFIDWYRQLCSVLSTEDKENYLEHHISVALVALHGQQVPPEALVAQAAWVKGSMYAISNKRAKINLDTSLLWRYRLGHISKKRIEKLQHDRLLNSINIESLGKCVLCLSCKMARKPYLDQVERAKDLLGLIHTDACGPFRIVSRQGANYFVTFTDDFSRYGYVYLLKHKHEVFETFKVFQKEVENQLGKTIKSLRSYCGGEYMSQEFLDHLKEHNAEFFKNNLRDPKASGSVEDLELIQEKDTNPSLDTSVDHKEDDQEINEPQSDINPTRKSSRTRHALDHMCLYINAEEHKLGDLGEPANYKAALLDPESKKWLDAMNVEIQSMKYNDVWVLVELPPNARTVGSKWLFKKKTDMDGVVYVFKARLVANGFTQTYGVDYEETFSHVADIRDIRILIAIAAYYNYEIWQIDVKTAFLSGHLSEEVYMEQPEGFVNPKYPNHVSKLKRSIYGLKQASRQWNKQFDDEIKKFGFTQNPNELCVYQTASGSYVAILILYVDDILLMGNNIPMLQDVKSYLGRSSAMNDLRDAAYILGIKIYHDRSKRLIEKLKLSKSEGASTPAEKQRMQNVPYALAIGSIMYVVRCNRPDVAFAQNITSRFQHNLGITERDLRVSCDNDAGYLTDADDLKSQTGYVFVLNGEAVWIRKFISVLGIVPTIEEPISMYCDNIGVIAIAKDDGVTKGVRYFYAKAHYLRETIQNWVM
nr:retrotransposon protein, putative, Ty1-copia subclass [Tanacetum cinerariifolium]